MGCGSSKAQDDAAAVRDAAPYFATMLQMVKRPARVELHKFSPVGVHPVPLYHCKERSSTGRVKGLFIGINYTGTKSALSGCINDVRTMIEALRDMSFPMDEACVLVDDTKFPGYGGHPTRINIIRHLQWLVHNIRRGDVLFLHFSGHGAWAPSEDGKTPNNCSCRATATRKGAFLRKTCTRSWSIRCPMGAG